MKLEELTNLYTAHGIDCLEQIKRAATGELSLYMVIKEDIAIFYDYVELTPTQDGQDEVLAIAEKASTVYYSRGDVLPLDILALEELWLHKKLDADKLASAFSSNDASLRFNSISKPYFVGLEDVYANTKELKGQKSDVSGRGEDAYTQAIRLAIENLGVTTASEELFKWVRIQTEDFNSDHHCIQDIDCEGDELIPYEAAKAKDFVLTSNNKPVTKKTFREQCSRIKRKMK